MDAPRFITLTLKHKPEPLFLTLARLRAAFRELRRHALWTSTTRGGVYSIEVKRNAETGCWHAHLHIVADGDFLAQARLAAVWLQITGDSQIVDIRAIRSRRDVALYVTKYISKPQDLHGWPPTAICEYARDMAGVRAVHTFGKHHGRRTEEADDGCSPGTCEPLASSRRILAALRAGSRRAAHAVHLLNRLGGVYAAALGLPRAPEGDEPEPLTVAEREELIDHLRTLGRDDNDLPPEQRRMREAMLRIAYETSDPFPRSLA